MYLLLLGIVGIVLVGLLALLVYSGLFYTYTIRCSIPASLPKRIAYTTYKGRYQDVGKVFCKLCDLVPHKRLFGIYYDDPKTVSILIHKVHARTHNELVLLKGFRITTLSISPTYMYMHVRQLPVHQWLLVYHCSPVYTLCYCT